MISLKKYICKVLAWASPVLELILKNKKDFDVLLSYKDKYYDAVQIESPYSILDSKIGKFTYISRYAHISSTNIGKFCSIGPNLFCGWGIHPTKGISTNPMFYSTKKQNGYSLTDVDKFVERKKIVIGNDVFIGANVTILDGVMIGDGAVIGAGAVVSKNIPPYAIAVGSPIRIIRYRMNEAQIAAMQRIQWWNWNEDKLQEVERMFFDIDKFIEIYDRKNE